MIFFSDFFDDPQAQLTSMRDVCDKTDRVVWEAYYQAMRKICDIMTENPDWLQDAVIKSGALSAREYLQRQLVKELAFFEEIVYDYYFTLFEKQESL